MRRPFIGAAVGLAVSLLLASAAMTTQTPTTEDFVKTVAINDMFEIQTGQLASHKGQSGDVKSFGEQMVTDHTKTSDELKDLIADKGLKVELPDKLDAEHQANRDKLNSVSGAQFDKEYVPAQIDAHRKAVDLFDNYAAGGENDVLKRWAKNTLPTLKQHLEHAQKLKILVDQPAQAGDAKKPDDTAARTDDLKKSGETPSRGNEHATSAANDDVKKPPHTTNIKYITRQTPTDWTAAALIGRAVENAQGDNLGDINNVIINEKGDVVAVVIGVGGFLGIGEKNVGVPFDALGFRTADPAEHPADKVKDEKATNDEKADQKADAKAARFDSEHANMHIELNTTKEDLEGAPVFAWLDDQNSDSTKDERP